MATSRSYAEMLVESLVPAMDIIASERLESVNFDRTIRCRIVDVSNANFGEYKVTDGTSTFKAYSEDRTYKKNELVYVTIPMNDFNNQKIIVGKVLDEEKQDDRFYKDPLDSFLDITGNLLSDEAITGIEQSDLGTIRANQVDSNQKPVLQKRIWSIRDYYFEGYELLALSGYFDTSMGQALQIKSGNYGLRLDIEVENRGVIETKTIFPARLFLDVKHEFFGNPYNTAGPTYQSALFDISSYSNIRSMSLYLIQDGDFKVSESEYYIPNSDVGGDEIYLKTPSVRLGYDISKFTEDTAFLFCPNKATYASYLTEDRKDLLIEAYKETHPDYLTTGLEAYTEFKNSVTINPTTQDELLKNLNKKKIQLRFIYFPEEGKPKGIFDAEDENCPEGMVIHWYRYKLAEDISDPLAGPYWVEQESLQNSFIWNDFYPNKELEFEQIKVIIEYPGKELVARIIYDNYDDFFKIEDDNGNIIDVLNELNHSDSWINSALTQYININKQKASENLVQQLQTIKMSDYDSYAAYENAVITLQSQLANSLNNQLNDLEEINNLPVKEKEETLYGNFTEDPFTTGEFFADWLDRCINRLEDQLLDYTNKTNDTVWQDARATQILEEYKEEIHAAAQAAGKSDQDFEFSAAANDIRDKYKKKIKNIVFDIETEIGKRRQVLEKIETELSKIHKVNSNILRFSNQDDVINKYNLQLVKGLTLEVDPDGYQGVYRCYDDLGYIMNKSDTSVRRVITANWTNIITGDKDDNKIEEIRWKFPSDNSMIQYPTEGYEYDFYIPVKITNEIVFGELKQQGLYTRSRDVATGAYVYTPVLKINSVTWNENIQYYQTSNAKVIKPSKPGDFFTIIRDGAEFQSAEPGSEEPSSSGQIFRIKEYYDQNATNNTIYCEVVRKGGKEVYSAQADLIFGPVGTNGTDYTFYLEIVGNDDPAVLTMDERNPASQVKVIPHLYNYENQDLFAADSPNRGIYIGKLKYRWFSPTSTTSWLLAAPNNQGIIEHSNVDGSITLTIDPTKNISDYMYYILAAEVENLTVTRKDTVTHAGEDENSDSSTATITLNTFLPIPIRSTATYKTVDGAFKVYYNAQGVSPEYYKDPYRMKIRSGVDNPPPRLIDFKPDNLKWEISLGRDTMISSALGSIKNFYPVMAVDNANEYKLIPPSYYLQDNGVEICVNCYLGDDIIWTQPLYICQNAYNSGLLNSWNGKLTIDENNGTILSTMVGAGKKDYKNRFEGVLMGDISVADDSIPTLGLYGYNEGVQSFGFKVDGTAFIGKSNRGRILMDGNNGSISSMSYVVGGETPTRGMKIDLDDGYIDMRGGAYDKLLYTSDFETFDRSIEGIESISENDKVYLTLENALKYYKAKIIKDKTNIQNQINNRHGFYQSIYNEKDEQIVNKFEKILNDIDKATIAFTEKIKDPITNIEKNKYLDDQSKIKYLQDNGLEYLLNNQYFSMNYVENENQARIQISVDDPYMRIISDNNVPILHIGKNKYFLQTDDFISDLQAKNQALVNYKKNNNSNFTYEAESIQKMITQNPDEENIIDNAFGKGFKITLKDTDGEGNIIPGGIEGYNFRLLGVNNGSISDYAYLKGSFFELNSSGDPFIKVHVRISGDNSSSSGDSGEIFDDSEGNNNNGSSNSKGNTFITKYKNYLSADEQEKNRHDKDILLIDSHNYLLQSLNYFDPKWDLDDFIEMHETGGINSKQAGHGTKLDLTDGSLIGHNFELTAIQNDEDEIYKAYAGSYVMLNSNGSPYFRIWHQYTPTGASTVQKKLQLLEISLNDFLIHSINWKEMKRVLVKNNNDEITDRYITPGAGIEMDLNGSYSRGNSKGKTASLITAYGFKLEAFNVPGYDEDSTRIEEKDYFGKRISINSMASGETSGDKCYTGRIEVTDIFNLSGLANQYDFSVSNNFYKIPNYIKGDDGKGYIERIVPDYPLIIGSMFSVSWDGQLECYYIKAVGGGQIGPFKFSPHALFSNQGVLGQLDWDKFDGISTEANDRDIMAGKIASSSINGIYLGIDGFSVGGSKFIIYNLPVNRSTNGDTSEAAKANEIDIYGGQSQIESADYSLTGKFKFNRDFVNIGWYPNNSSLYPETGGLIYKYPYDLTYKTSEGTTFKPRDITMYVRGNSLLDGVTHINGSTYVMGTFQVGNISDIGNTNSSSQSWDDIKNYAILYANTRVYGVFQTTGKTYLGDSTNNWVSEVNSLKSIDYKTESEKESDNFGCIIYRNTYITGTLHVGSSYVYFGCTNEEGVLHEKSKVASDGYFESYIKTHYLHGDLNVSRAFIAGLDAAEAGDDESANFSAIISKTITLGRINPVVDGVDKQSNLNIYANIYQYGNLETVADYNGSIKLETISGDKTSFIKLYNGILELSSSGTGTITINNSGVSLVGGGSSLSIDGNGLSITVPGENSSFSLSQGAFSVSAGGASLSLDSGGFRLSTGSSSLTTLTTGEINLSGAITMNQSSGNMIINGTLEVHGDIYANNLHASGWNSDGTDWAMGEKGSGGLEAGIKEGWIAGWIIKEETLQDDEDGKAVIGLDPKDAKIWFGKDKSDYLDGGGRDAGTGHGAILHSKNLIHLEAKKEENDDGGEEIEFTFKGTKKVRFTTNIETAEDIKFNGTMYLGYDSSSGTGGTEPQASPYFINKDEANFKKVNIFTGSKKLEIFNDSIKCSNSPFKIDSDEGLTFTSTGEIQLTASTSGEKTGNVTINASGGKLTLNGSEVELQRGSTTYIKLVYEESSSGSGAGSDYIKFEKLLKSSDIEADGALTVTGNAKFDGAVGINNTLTISQDNESQDGESQDGESQGNEIKDALSISKGHTTLKNTTISGTLSVTDDVTLSKKLTIIGKNDLVIDGQTLGALAFVDNIKKKFDVSLSGTFSTVKYGSNSSQNLYVKTGSNTYYKQNGSQNIIEVEDNYSYFKILSTAASGKTIRAVNAGNSSSMDGSTFYKSAGTKTYYTVTIYDQSNTFQQYDYNPTGGSWLYLADGRYIRFDQVTVNEYDSTNYVSFPSSNHPSVVFSKSIPVYQATTDDNYTKVTSCSWEFDHTSNYITLDGSNTDTNIPMVNDDFSSRTLTITAT